MICELSCVASKCGTFIQQGLTQHLQLGLVRSPLEYPFRHDAKQRRWIESRVQCVLVERDCDDRVFWRRRMWLEWERLSHGLEGANSSERFFKTNTLNSEATGAPFHNFIARSAETHPACIVIFSKMAFLGLRKWPTPVSFHSLYQPNRHSTAFILQFLKPMWPFMAAGTITFYLVAKLQDAAVRCEFARIQL